MCFAVGYLLSVMFFVSNFILVKNVWTTTDYAPLRGVLWSCERPDLVPPCILQAIAALVNFFSLCQL